MAVADEPAPTIHQHLVVRGGDGEIQQHLIHFRITVAPYRHDAGSQCIESLGHGRRGIARRHRVARAVIEQIAEQQIVIRLPGASWSSTRSSALRLPCRSERMAIFMASPLLLAEVEILVAIAP